MNFAKDILLSKFYKWQQIKGQLQKLIFEGVLKIVTMVSKTNAAIVGVALIGVLFFLRSRGSTSIVPSGSEISIPAITENPQIAVVKGQIKQVESFIKDTFKQTPFQRAQKRLVDRIGATAARKIIRSSSTIDGVRVPSRNQTFPKGSRFSTDPFTGLRIALPVGPRGSSVTERFFGGAAGLQTNLTKVTFGTDLFKQSSTLLDNLKEKLGLLQTTNIVSL